MSGKPDFLLVDTTMLFNLYAAAGGSKGWDMLLKPGQPVAVLEGMITEHSRNIDRVSGDSPPS